MIYILFFLGVNATPANLGEYTSLESCVSSIRSIYEFKNTPKGVDLSPQLKDGIKMKTDLDMKYKRDYQCILKTKERLK